MSFSAQVEFINQAPNFKKSKRAKQINITQETFFKEY
jgi:hypothetical protein